MALTWAWIAGALIGWFWVAPIVAGPIEGIVHTVFRGAAGYSSLATPYPATKYYAYHAGSAPGTVNVLSPNPKYFRRPY